MVFACDLWEHEEFIQNPCFPEEVVQFLFLPFLAGLGNPSIFCTHQWEWLKIFSAVLCSSSLGFGKLLTMCIVIIIYQLNQKPCILLWSSLYWTTLPQKTHDKHCLPWVWHFTNIRTVYWLSGISPKAYSNYIRISEMLICNLKRLGVWN